MASTYILHKLPEGFVVTSDEEYKEGKEYNNLVYNEGIVFKTNQLLPQFKQVIAQQDQIIFNIPEEEQKKIGWFDVEKLTEENCKNIAKHYGGYQCYVRGFQKAQELLSDKEFTREDVKKLVNSVTEFMSHNEPEEFDEWFERKLQSLSQKSWKVQLEMGDLYEEDLENNVINEPKLTNGKVTITKIL
jgi:hypothetical protein